ncbi:MAG: geranylgeranyl diphosphate reductase, partial [Sphingomonadaceae bacterium]|nr:geranylgeranyl diphosphate reductase [Sphingomonadaceae bacterium]
MTDIVDCVVVGGGPSGATAAMDLARAGRSVVLLDRAGRIKPCGGAIPPRLMRDFAVPESVLVGHATAARMVAPSNRAVDMPIEGGFVGMVDRGAFDEWLRNRAALAGARRETGTYEAIERDPDGTTVVVYRPKGAARHAALQRLRTRSVIGADGARSGVARATLKRAERTPCVFAYHEVIATPPATDRERCDIYYQGHLSPDFYAWIFPHGDQTSVGVGSANKGFSLKDAVARLRADTGLDAAATIRVEGAPIPLKPLKKWDNGRDVVVAGDAAGVVAPASGEGIYYAMTAGREAATSVDEFLQTGNPKALAGARRRFMKAHGRVFWILGMMQHFWYRNDRRRERFVSICRDPDVQALTWQAYMNKELVRARPAAHLRIFFK